jgi:hypothetical protein
VHPPPATQLHENERTLRQARREIAYDRTGVVNRRDLGEFFALAAQVLPALSRRTCAVIEFEPPPRDLVDWAIPDLG